MNRYVNREIRGRIMKILNLNYPTPANEHLIGEILTDLAYTCSPPQVMTHLNYLEEKGYVKMQDVEVKEFDIHRCLVRLTAKGKDLLEGSIDADPGVDLDG